MRGPSKATEASEHMERLVREDEELVWHAKPDETAFYVTGIVGGLVLAGFLAPFVGMPMTMVLGTLLGVFGGEAALLWTFGGLLALALVAVPLAVWAITRRRYRFAEYAVTHDRVLEVSGLFGRDSSTVSLEDVRDIDVSVGLTGKLFDTGRLSFQTAGGSDAGVSFNHISDPYDVLERIEEVRHRGADPRADRTAPGAAPA